MPWRRRSGRAISRLSGMLLDAVGCRDTGGGGLLPWSGADPRALSASWLTEDSRSAGGGWGTPTAPVNLLHVEMALTPGTEGGVTAHLPDGQPMTIFGAATRYGMTGFR